MTDVPNADWYPDPSGRHEFRYWDGTGWTEHVSDSGVVSVAPLGEPSETTDEAGSRFRLSPPMLIAGLVVVAVIIGLIVFVGGGGGTDGSYGTKDVDLRPGDVHTARYRLRAGEVVRVRAVPTHRDQDPSIVIGVDRSTAARLLDLAESADDYFMDMGDLDRDILTSDEYHSDAFADLESSLTGRFSRWSDDRRSFDPGFEAGEVFMLEQYDWEGRGEGEALPFLAPVDGTYVVMVGDLNNVGETIEVTVEKWNQRFEGIDDFILNSDLYSDFSDVFEDRLSDFEDFVENDPFFDDLDYSDAESTAFAPATTAAPAPTQELVPWQSEQIRREYEDYYNAVTVYLGDSRQGDLYPSGDEDHYILEVHESIISSNDSSIAIVIETSGSTDTLLALSQLGTLGSASRLASDDDDGQGSNARIQAWLEPGWYLVTVSGYGAGMGDYALSIRKS